MNIGLDFLAQITFWLPCSVLMLMVILALIFRKRLGDIEHLFGWLTTGSSFILLIVSGWMLTIPKKEAMFSIRTPIIRIPIIGLFSLSIDLHLDALSIFMVLLINVVAFATSWNAFSYLAHTPQSGKKWWQKGWLFHCLIHLFHFTMLLVPLADNLVVVWIAIELTTLGSAILIVYEDKKSAWEATWKYLVVTSAGIVLALLGTIFLANSLPKEEVLQNPTNELLNWSYLMEHKGILDDKFVWIAFLFAVVGYGTKAGVAPLHTWLPDGHGEAPSPVSALLSGVLLKASFYVVLRFFILTNAVLGEQHHSWTYLTLLFGGLLSLIVSTPLILRSQTPFKRVLAYHSLEHMGIIAFGFGVGGFLAVAGAILHMLNHAITKALMFLAYGNLLNRYGKEGIPIQGALRTMPWSGGFLTLGGLALVGTPPFNIFMSEWMILWGALARFFPHSNEFPYTKPVLSVISISLFILSTTLIFYGLVSHLRKMVLDKSAKEIAPETFRWSAIAPLLFLFVFILLFGIWIVPPIAELVRESTNIVLHISH